MTSIVALARVIVLSLAVVTVSCCPSGTVNLIAELEPQYISSPNYPGHYGDSASGQRISCAWLITANSSFEDVVVEMMVHNSSLEPATGCWRDVVEVIDGYHDFHMPLESWCGSGGPSGTFMTSGTQALVKFSTNFKDNDYFGFLMSYWIVKKPLFIVNAHPWTAINYVLLAASIVMLGFLPVSFIGVLIARIAQERKKKKLQ